MRAIAGDVPPEARALLDGVDVSIRCVAADDAEGWADLVAVDKEGKLVFEDKDPKVERHHGKVEITLPPEWEWMRAERVVPK